MEDQRDWYETVKGMTIAERNHFLSNLGRALRDDGAVYGSYESFTQKVHALGYRGVLELGHKCLKEIEHDSAVAGVDTDSLAIIAKHINLCETLLDAFIKRANEKNTLHHGETYHNQHQR